MRFKKGCLIMGYNEVCENLTKQLPCEFAGLAVYNQYGKEIKWKYVVGNRNDKYKRINVRYGKGIAGKVVRTGTPIIIPCFPEHMSGKATDYPIMLAEQLISCIAVPIRLNQTIWGVLMGGNRSQCHASQDQLQIIQQAVGEIEKCLTNKLYMMPRW
jgi:nitrogen regulatory protein A